MARSEALRKRLAQNTDLYPVHALRRQQVKGVDTYGDIPGVLLFSTWMTRKACLRDGVHRAGYAGIQGGTQGATSICLSTAYDDTDNGDEIVYTGTGGNAGKDAAFGAGGQQVQDQSFTHPMNACLKRSQLTANPVRVIRGANPHSAFAPEEGYRYDGLYTVTESWYEKHPENGLTVCRYRLKRIPGQDPIPLKGMK